MYIFGTKIDKRNPKISNFYVSALEKFVDHINFSWVLFLIFLTFAKCIKYIHALCSETKSNQMS